MSDPLDIHYATQSLAHFNRNDPKVVEDIEKHIREEMTRCQRAIADAPPRIKRLRRRCKRYLACLMNGKEIERNIRRLTNSHTGSLMLWNYEHGMYERKPPGYQERTWT